MTARTDPETGVTIEVAEWTWYIEVLLATSRDTAVLEIASRADAMGRTAKAAEYLERVWRQNVEGARAHEVSWDLWAMATGVPA